jgi:hypothetical protein
MRNRHPLVLLTNTEFDVVTKEINVAKVPQDKMSIFRNQCSRLIQVKCNQHTSPQTLDQALDFIGLPMPDLLVEQAIDIFARIAAGEGEGDLYEGFYCEIPDRDNIYDDPNSSRRGGDPIYGEIKDQGQESHYGAVEGEYLQVTPFGDGDADYDLAHESNYAMANAHDQDPTYSTASHVDPTYSMANVEKEPNYEMARGGKPVKKIEGFYDTANSGRGDPTYDTATARRGSGKDPNYALASQYESSDSDPVYDMGSGQAEPKYVLANNGANEPTYSMANQGNEPKYVLANNSSQEPTYSTATMGREPKYALANDRSQDPTYSTATAVGKEPKYALANDRSQEPTYSMANQGSEPTYASATAGSVKVKLSNNPNNPLYNLDTNYALADTDESNYATADNDDDEQPTYAAASADTDYSEPQRRVHDNKAYKTLPKRGTDDDLYPVADASGEAELDFDA